ncbi:NADH-quinone oxidoreductase subunit NuoE [Limimaricola litoreus]|uniref:NADH-quinone oxidoreductase subunit NuoE n=1 Tax=Limimaricola litoreus TaxID=2955316 RepID=A0A9X2FML0_9RHOB|nr:NADH-quinone oxidoreductase subunit NuoE [Limimaricola litoreus]MCP1167509.1 NADH-quinone oxidoreductase subunit NuoE [Limimaricola litoreus]
MLRRLHPEQPESFAFTPANQAWAEAQITKYPEGRQASAIIPLLWRAQEQEGWLSRPAIEEVARMLDLAYIRALEVATFYFMFQLQPVGSVAHIQVCGTLSCMLCGSEDLMKVCQEKIAKKPHELSADGRFSWEEVECLGACANAPMAQIGKDYYEDLTTERLSEIIDEMAAGKVPVPGPQNGRYTSEPLDNLTSLAEGAEDRDPHNASVALAVKLGDTIKRIDGTEEPLRTPWQRQDDHEVETPLDPKEPEPAHDRPADASGVTEQEAPASSAAKPVSADFPAEEPQNAIDGEEAPEGGEPVAPSGEAAPATDANDTTEGKTGAADPVAPGGVYNAPRTQEPGDPAKDDKSSKRPKDK